MWGRSYTSMSISWPFSRLLCEIPIRTGRTLPGRTFDFLDHVSAARSRVSCMTRLVLEGAAKQGAAKAERRKMFE
jgi:hypothetical protein